MHQFHRPDLPSAPRRALPAFLGRALRAATSPGAIARGLFAAAAALALCAAPAFAQCTNYTVVAGPAQYITAGTDIGNHDDEAMTSITLPFPVSVYGNTYTSAYVSSNGYIEFGSDGQFYQNSCLPLSNTDYSTFISASSPTVVAILPFWTDLSTYNPLSPDNGKGVYTEVLGTPGSQDFVVEWRAFANGLTDSTVFFEVIFHENQTYFDYVYYTLPALSNATIGVSRTDLDIMTFALTHTAAQYECFANTLGATAVKGFGSTSLRFTWCASTVGACCDSEAACIVAFSSDSCQGTSQFQPGVACSPSPCTAPSNDGCASATDIASLFFPNDPNPIDNGAAADDTTDCGTASHGIWYSYFASEDTALRCAAIGSQKASWATAPDCSTLPHCVSGGTSTSVFVPAGQSVNLLASNASPAADPAAPLILSFHTRTAVSDSACTIAPTTTAYVAGDTDIGNHSSPGTDASTALAFPFPVSLYGLSYTGANVSDNGYIEFGGPTANPSYLCLPVSNLPNAAIFPYREDLITSTAGGKGIFTSVSGSPGSRQFVVEWRAARYSVYVSPNTIQMKFEVIFYENQPYFDMVYDTIPAFGGATVGVQASGTGPSTEFECNSNVGNA
ncbi:MAG TPA: hypothetical protein VHC70_13995, partial [Phycisphaerales bacterium]|nr:hypothetical protein [Phycisphaerales bacterium]